MRRAVLAVIVTVFGLVLLLSFKPHDVAVASRPPAAVSGSGQSEQSDHQAESQAENEDEDDDEGQARIQTGSQTGGQTGGSVAGNVVDTRWGPVQVAITVGGGRISSVDVLRAPDGNRRDIEINQRALPILVQETLDAQSAQIDMVSGATYTSEGYIGSLQSAIDQAGL